MDIKQFEYKPLAHYSYTLVSESKMVIIDPERNPEQYYNYAKQQNATIIAVIETHPHADFVSSHLQIHNDTDADVYNSSKLNADYPHKSFDDGDEILLGNITLKAINTPGHSPDSITVVASENDEIALFTGDTLFVGDIGRPDLREIDGNMETKRKELAEKMYHTITEKFKNFPDDAKVFPAHGAGSLCGKGMSDENSSTLGDERKNNWAFKHQTREEFIDTLLEGQPFIPSYFSYNVSVNKAGASSLKPSISEIPFFENAISEGLIVDTRDEANFKKNHLEGSFNIQAVSKNAKFETWLGSIITPEEKFTVVIENKEKKNEILHRVAKIGYEKFLEKIITLPKDSLETSNNLNIQDFKNNLNNYTIVDIRNTSEVEKDKIFNNAISHPLNKLRDTLDKIPTDKPIMVHCAGGYRSAAGASILERKIKDVKIYDLSDQINQFK